MECLSAYPHVQTLVARQCASYPGHTPFLTRRFRNADEGDLRLCDEIAAQVLRLGGDELDLFASGYDFVCDIQTREEFFFRRNNRYRCSSAEAAQREVYDNPQYMSRYMRGLLMTQVFWANHSASMAFYLREFLPRNVHGYALLEVGPGHGLLLSRAADDPRAGSLRGWDISAASIERSREALRRLGNAGTCTLEERDLLSSNGSRERFDAVVFSEILEHLEEPARALEILRGLMRPGGRLYINVPVNSPAPDHLFLLRSPEAAVAFIESHGFRIEKKAFFPATNYTLEAARRHALTISVCVIASPISLGM